MIANGLIHGVHWVVEVLIIIALINVGFARSSRQ